MPRILHVSDLHLTARESDRTYALAVLEEVATHAAELQVDALLIAGHLTDGTTQYEQLGDTAGPALRSLPCPAFCLAVDDEPTLESAPALRDPLDPVTCLDATPFSLATIGRGPEAVEILAAGAQPTLREEREWAIPAKRAPHRLLVARALVAGHRFADVDTDAVLDAELFARFEVDCAALGGAHTAPDPFPVGETLVAFPGSARVTQMRESGPRAALLIDFGDNTRARKVPLVTAGQYRRHDLWIEDPFPDNATTESWGRHDWIDLRLAGVVPSDAAAESLVDELERCWSERVRRLTIDDRALARVPDPAAVAVARRFQRQCAAELPADEALRAWHLGVRALAGRVGSPP
jgi:hypothetical protein